MSRGILLVLMLTAGLILLVSCSDESAPLATDQVANDDFDTIDFNDPYGGLTASDEDVAFGDDALQALLLAEVDEAVDDPLAADPEVLALEAASRGPGDRENAPRPRFTYLRLRWGMLHGPDDSVSIEPPCDVVDWTGTIRTDRGIVVVKRVIRFERPVDHIIWPRLDRQTVAFQSFTGCHFDGLVLQIIEPVPAGDMTPPETPNMLHIDLPLYEASFAVSELGDLDLVEDVTDTGARIELTGFTLADIEICPKGFLSGRWRSQPRAAATAQPDTADCGERLGSFAGAWYSLDGRINGFLRGGYGVNADGLRVFRGKAIDRGGRFHALLAGTWEPADDDGLASFVGDWVLASGRVEGRLGGTAQRVEGYPGGFFTGRWASLCDDEAAADVD
jgi:hypothetical protein